MNMILKRPLMMAGLVLVSALGTVSPAFAQTSEASFGITVYVPPIADALDAAERGAVGSWTVGTGGDTLMILAPGVAKDVAGDGAFSIYRSEGHRFSVAIDRLDEKSVLRETLQDPGRGLTRFDYLLPM
jgi:hypothetical protein